MPTSGLPSRAAMCLLALGVMAVGLVAADAEEPSSSPCLESTIAYSTSALDRLVHDPDGVLADEEGFWNDEDAQQFTLGWAKANGFTLSRERWRKAVAAFVAQTPSERRTSPLVSISRSIVARKDVFLDGAVPHLCSFFPQRVVLDVPVVFTAFIPPRAFAYDGIVVNVSAKYWNGNPDNVLNSLVHELFHVGYSQLRASWKGRPQGPEAVEPLLDALHNEGMATYAAYEARFLFPAPDERDFSQIEDAAAAGRLRGELNALFASVGAAAPAKLKRRAWRTGVTRRGYYVVGAAMARTIDTELGRSRLIETLVQGPAAFVTTYNGLVGAGERVIVPDAAAVAARERRAHRGRLVLAICVGVVLLGGLVLGIAVWRRHTA